MPTKLKITLQYIARFLMLMLTLTSLPTLSQTKKPQYLFILSARSGVFYHKNTTTYLQLNHVDSHTLWFTDRPNRKAGFIPTQQLIQRWKIGFKNVPPNAGLIHADMAYQKHGSQQPLALEISQPIIKNHHIIFRVITLSGDTKLMLNKHKKMRHLTLFIDPPAARLVDFHEMPMT